MSRSAWRGVTSGFVALVLGVLVLAPAARATNPIYNHWKALYPDSKSDDSVLAGTGAACQLCHANSGGGNPWNAYGWEIRKNLLAGGFIDGSIVLAGTVDSDGDPTGSTNLEEILADAQPGWTYGTLNMWFNGDGSTVSGKHPPQGIEGYLDSVWTKLPFATLPGSNGLPDLAGSGSLKAGTPLGLTLSQAKPLAPALMFIGFSEIDAPFKGGVLVPAVDLLVPLTTDGGGSATLPGSWPGGIPPGFDVWLQCWIADPAGPAGLSASNGLIGTAN